MKKLNVFLLFLQSYLSTIIRVPSRKLNSLPKGRILQGPVVDQKSLAPVMAPQLTDPRIEVQTYNAPNQPVLPNVLPKPQIQVNIHMPKQ